MTDRVFIFFCAALALIAVATFAFAIINHGILVDNSKRGKENRVLICKHLVASEFDKEYFRCPAAS